MNQSKRNGLLLISAILILIISAIWLACSEGPRMNADGSLSNVSWDSQYAYAPQIEGTVDVTNWHSALFMYEMRLVHNWSAALVEKIPRAAVYAFSWQLGIYTHAYQLLISLVF